MKTYWEVQSKGFIGVGPTELEAWINYFLMAGMAFDGFIFLQVVRVLRAAGITAKEIRA